MTSLSEITNYIKDFISKVKVIIKITISHYQFSIRVGFDFLKIQQSLRCNDTGFAFIFCEYSEQQC